MDWAALIGVGGTLAGAALGYFGEHVRWKRDQESRWSDERRALYTKIIDECQMLAEEGTSELLGMDHVTFDELLRVVNPVQERVRPLITDLELIGTEDDAKAARDLEAGALRFLHGAVRNPDASAYPAYVEWADELGRFKRQARAGLHLSRRRRRSPIMFLVTLGPRLRALRGAPREQPPA